MAVWDFKRVESLIVNGVEESLTLEYKAAAALEKTDRAKTELTKDISALANSAGGTLIYGVGEDPKSKHLPDPIGPISRRNFPKEWLEQVANNIRPRIEGLLIHPISIPGSAPDDVLYVVEVPQSDTAHQGSDYRYYRRFNFQSVPMDDYEIRDVMSRSQHPLVSVECELVAETHEVRDGTPFNMQIATRKIDRSLLKIKLLNRGRRVANYVVGSILIPTGILDEHEAELHSIVTLDDVPHHEIDVKNLVRDVVGVTQLVFDSILKYGEHRFEPILPDLPVELRSLKVDHDAFAEAASTGVILRWHVHADAAVKRSGQTALRDIPFRDERHR